MKKMFNFNIRPYSPTWDLKGLKEYTKKSRSIKPNIKKYNEYVDRFGHLKAVFLKRHESKEKAIDYAKKISTLTGVNFNGQVGYYFLKKGLWVNDRDVFMCHYIVKGTREYREDEHIQILKHCDSECILCGITQDELIKNYDSLNVFVDEENKRIEAICQQCEKIHGLSAHDRTYDKNNYINNLVKAIQ